jgi:hypothetical protein
MVTKPRFWYLKIAFLSSSAFSKLTSKNPVFNRTSHNYVVISAVFPLGMYILLVSSSTQVFIICVQASAKVAFASIQSSALVPKSETTNLQMGNVHAAYVRNGVTIRNSSILTADPDRKV